MRRKKSLVASFVLIAAGVVLMPAISARASSTFAVLHNFDNTGYIPSGNLIFDSKGNIYGTTTWGGLASPNCSSNCGVVFELSPSGGSWTYKTIYSFTGGSRRWRTLRPPDTRLERKPLRHDVSWRNRSPIQLSDRLRHGVRTLTFGWWVDFYIASQLQRVGRIITEDGANTR
jgi:uncharacterized repeat protein (TIGR03803 family)